MGCRAESPASIVCALRPGESFEVNTGDDVGLNARSPRSAVAISDTKVLRPSDVVYFETTDLKRDQPERFACLRGTNLSVGI
jgi:hypothetical protein